MHALSSAGLAAGGTNTRLVGEDSFGNKYYEDTTRPYGRHRWVIYQDMANYNARCTGRELRPLPVACPRLLGR